jgi:hypothetical protein
LLDPNQRSAEQEGRFAELFLPPGIGRGAWDDASAVVARWVVMSPGLAGGVRSDHGGGVAGGLGKTATHAGIMSACLPECGLLRGFDVL